MRQDTLSSSAAVTTGTAPEPGVAKVATEPLPELRNITKTYGLEATKEQTSIEELTQPVSMS